LTRTSFPIPGRVKDPAFLVSETAKAATSSMIAAAAFLESSNFPAKWETIRDLVMGFLATLGLLFGWIIKLDSGSILEKRLRSKRKDSPGAFGNGTIDLLWMNGQGGFMERVEWNLEFVYDQTASQQKGSLKERVGMPDCY
jgi:hypothetical protein